MSNKDGFSRRKFLIGANCGLVGLSLSAMPMKAYSQSQSHINSEGVYFPPREDQGGWRTYDPALLPGIDAEKLADAIRFHDQSPVSTSRGAALLIIHEGRLIGESYVTGNEGGPENWTASTCNDMKSSTKSVFGTMAWNGNKAASSGL